MGLLSSCHAIWADQCTRGIHGFDEPGFLSMLGPVRSHFINDIIIFSRSEIEREQHPLLALRG